MPRTGRALALVPALVALSLAARARADQAEEELASWLALPDTTLERSSREVLEQRSRDPRLARRLEAIAQDVWRPVEVRRAAIVLWGALEDESTRGDALAPLEEEPALAAATRKARERIAARGPLVARLLRAGRALEESEPSAERRAAEAVRDVAVTASSTVAVRELRELARDPLLESHARGKGRAAAIRALGLVDPAVRGPAIATLADLAADRWQPPLARAEALLALVRTGEATGLVRAVRSCLASPDESVLRAALEAMPALGAAGRLDELASQELAETPTLEARARLALALGRADSQVAVVWLERLEREAATDEALVRAAATIALARLGARPPEQTAMALALSLGDSRTAVVAQAVDGLAALPAATAAAALAPRLRDARPDTRARAASAARALGLRSLAPDLVRIATNATQGETLTTRLAAVRALAELGDSRAAARAVASILDSEGGDPEPETAALRREACRALGSPALRGDAARAALVHALDDDEPIVRRAALKAIAALDDPRTIDPLLPVLGRPEWQARERVEAIHTLGGLGARDLEATRAVEGALRQDGSAPVAIAVVDFLQRVPTRFAARILADLLLHDDPAVRRRAHAGLLGRFREATDPTGYDPDAARDARQGPAEAWRARVAARKPD